MTAKVFVCAGRVYQQPQPPPPRQQQQQEQAQQPTTDNFLLVGHFFGGSRLHPTIELELQVKATGVGWLS
jgi:hypothetical protein